MFMIKSMLEVFASLNEVFSKHFHTQTSCRTWGSNRAGFHLGLLYSWYRSSCIRRESKRHIVPLLGLGLWVSGNRNSVKCRQNSSVNFHYRDKPGKSQSGIPRWWNWTFRQRKRASLLNKIGKFLLKWRRPWNYYIVYIRYILSHINPIKQFFFQTLLDHCWVSCIDFSVLIGAGQRLYTIILKKAFSPCVNTKKMLEFLIHIG
jgi:hypothetical protein